jgi:F0F1-type ATP synthase membrane subunit b/b'
MTPEFFEAVALWSQVAGAVAFLVVLIIMFRKFLIPAVEANEKARNAEIAAAEARSVAVKADAAAARAEFETAQAEAARIRASGAEHAKHELARILAEAKTDGEHTIFNAEGELARARMAASDRLRIEFIEKALVRARIEAVTRVDAATNTRLVNGTIDDLTSGRT